MIGLIPTMKAIQKKSMCPSQQRNARNSGRNRYGRSKKQGVQIIPIDSEHSAIFQCLRGHTVEDIKRIILTAQEAFRGYSKERLKHVSPQEALNIQIGIWKEEASILLLMNKGLEV